MKTSQNRLLLLAVPVLLLAAPLTGCSNRSDAKGSTTEAQVAPHPPVGGMGTLSEKQMRSIKEDK